LGGSVQKREYVHNGHDSGGAGEASSRSFKREAKINAVDAAASSSFSATFSLSSEVADALRAEVERLSNENRNLVRRHEGVRARRHSWRPFSRLAH
jgi:hypothetical protein